MLILRSNRRELLCKNFAKFTGKYMCWNHFLVKLQYLKAYNFIKKGPQRKCFFFNFAKFWRTLTCRIFANGCLSHSTFFHKMAVIHESCNQKQPPEVFYKKIVLKKFAKFTVKYLYQSLFFNKVAGLRQIRPVIKHNDMTKTVYNYLIWLHLANTS